jgi:hypothetical protein
MKPAAAIALGVLALAGAVQFARLGLAQTEPGERPGGTAASPTPVVLELFTSEGCSSCPPADALLRRVAATQPFDGVQLIALGEHVDYWDDLGWRDRFAAPEFTARQRDYARRAFRSGTIYTPQIVIDGAYDAPGSDPVAVHRAVEHARKSAKATVRATLGAPSAAAVPIRVDVALGAARTLGATADVLVATVEDDLTTQVLRGENSGRTLDHDAVVRRLARIGTIDASADALVVTATIPLDAEWRREQLRWVVLVQDRASGRVIGAAAVQ